MTLFITRSRTNCTLYPVSERCVVQYNSKFRGDRGRTSLDRV